MSAATTPALDLAALKAAAEKATPGEWHPDIVSMPWPDERRFAATTPPVRNERQAERDRAYLIAANPAAILALLDALAEARRERDALRNIHANDMHDIALLRTARAEQVTAALAEAVAVIEDYLAYEHDGDPWSEDRRAMGEMEINNYGRDGRLARAKAILAAERGDAEGGEHG